MYYGYRSCEIFDSMMSASTELAGTIEIRATRSEIEMILILLITATAIITINRRKKMFITRHEHSFGPYCLGNRIWQVLKMVRYVH